MQPLVFRVVERTPGLELAPADARALDEIISWKRQPTFAIAGRTAWYVLEQPLKTRDGGPTLKAVKIKGAGAWDPAAQKVTPPSTDEYVETALAAHFGVDSAGEFASVRSEAAPYGAILLRRARQEFRNAQTLWQAGVPTVVPYALNAYEQLDAFQGEPLGTVCSLAPDPSPYSLQWMLLGIERAPPEQRPYCEAVLTRLDAHGFERDQVKRLAVLSAVGQKIGALVRRLAQAGLYRYSAGWDNYYLDQETGEPYLTDLDSTRCLSELPDEVRGMQVMRDMAGALYRILNKLYHPNNIGFYQLSPMLDADPLAHLLAGYFDLSLERCRTLAVPLWNYFVPHWFLLKRHQAELTTWSDERRQTYKMDKDLFHGLAISVLADEYQTECVRLGLPKAPAAAELRARVRRFLGERGDIESFLRNEWERS